MLSNHLMLCRSLLLLPSIFPSIRSFPVCQLFTSGGQSIGASASVLPMNIQDWFPLGLTNMISLQSKGPSRESTNWIHSIFIIGDWNAKVESQEIHGVTGKFTLGVQNEAVQRLIEFCEENALVMANTLVQQYKGRIYTWTSPDGQYQNQIDYILCSQRWRSSIQSAKTGSWLWLRSWTPYCQIQT